MVEVISELIVVLKIGSTSLALEFELIKQYNVKKKVDFF